MLKMSKLGQTKKRCRQYLTVALCNFQGRGLLVILDLKFSTDNRHYVLIG